MPPIRSKTTKCNPKATKSYSKATKSNPKALLKHEFERLAPGGSQIPSGYIFVPKGDPYITRHCRHLTAESHQVLYVVYDEKTMERLGLRCSVDVFEEVTEKASSSAQYRKDIVEARDRRDIDNARTALMHLFPRIPIAVAEAILLHGFEKGSGRVGRTGTIESDEKVTLAVIAYARHNFTPYEEHIREFRRGMEGNKAKPLAREAIRDQLQEVLTAWRSSNVSVIPSSLKEAKKKHEVKTRPTKGAKTSRHRPTISTPKKRTAMKKKSANGAPRGIVCPPNTPTKSLALKPPRRKAALAAIRGYNKRII